MTVSILMPTYNHERFIAQAIESVLAQQTQYDFELLINDDCSTVSNSSDYEKDVAFQDSIFDIQKYIVDKHGTGKLSFDDISDSSVMIHLMSAMRFGKLNDFVRFSKNLKSKELKFRLLRWFPRLWYFQHKIRVGDR